MCDSSCNDNFLTPSFFFSSPAGDKYTNAIPWNIHTVNHFWLEESYDHWSLRKEGRQHYQAYPPGLSKTVGQVSVTHDIVNKSLSKAKELLNMEITENDGIIQKSASVTTTTNTSASSSSSIRTPQTTAASTIVVAATTSSSSSTSKASAPLRSSSVILTTTSTSPALPTSSTTNRSHHLQPQQHQQQVDTKSFAVKGKRSARAPRDSTVTNQNDNDDENNKEKNDDEDDNENENEAVMDVVEKEATTSISITTKKNGNSDDAGGAPSSSSSNRGKRRRLSENPSSVTSANTSALMTTTEERRESPLTRAARARSTGLVATISPNVSIASSSRRATTMRFLFTGCQPDKELRMVRREGQSGVGSLFHFIKNSPVLKYRKFYQWVPGL